MAMTIDPARLFEAFAQAIDKRLLPSLADADARVVADAGRMLAAHLHVQLRSAPGAPQPQPIGRGDVARLVAETADADQFVALLEHDARSHRAAAAALQAELARIIAAADERPACPDEGALTAYLRSRTGDPAAVARNVTMAVGGYSKQTVLFDMVAGDGGIVPLVMRRDLHIANIGTSVVDEFDILLAIHRTGFPVAEPLWLESGSDVLPGSFLVSRRVAGRVTGDPLGVTGTVDFDPARALAVLLARLHAIDVDGLAVAGYSDIHFDEQVQRARIAEWRTNYEHNVAQPIVALEIGLAWLEENVHLALGRKVVVHGEVGFHNLLFEDGRITALLDWELAHAGNPADDLAYVRRFVEPYAGFENFLARYAEAGGQIPPAHALAYFEVFGNVRNAILGVMGMRHFNDGAHHDLPLVRIILTTGAAYVDTLTRLLGGLISRHGFHWTIEDMR